MLVLVLAGMPIRSNAHRKGAGNTVDDIGIVEKPPALGERPLCVGMGDMLVCRWNMISAGQDHDTL
jgi:hypothetical protein